MKIIYHKSVDKVKLPEVWKVANVTRIFKKESKCKPENYNPFTLTSIPGKILEICLKDPNDEYIK